MTVTVGTREKKEVSELNHELFQEARDTLAGYKIGWRVVGEFIDWLEKNYDIKKKTA